MTAARLVIAAWIVAGTVSIATLANVVWQNVYCGVPICATNPFQVEPCEPVDKVLAEWRELEQKARAKPAK